MAKLSRFHTENPQVLGAILKKILYGDMEPRIFVPMSHGKAWKQISYFNYVGRNVIFGKEIL